MQSITTKLAEMMAAPHLQESPQQQQPQLRMLLQQQQKPYLFSAGLFIALQSEPAVAAGIQQQLERVGMPQSLQVQVHPRYSQFRQKFAHEFAHQQPVLDMTGSATVTPKLGTGQGRARGRKAGTVRKNCILMERAF